MHNSKRLHGVNVMGSDNPNAIEVEPTMQGDFVTTEDTNKKAEQVFDANSYLNNWLKYNWYTITILFSFGGAITAVVLFLNQGISAIDIAILVFMFILTGIGGEAGLHRLFAHKSYEVAKPIRILLAIAGSMFGEAPIIEYAAFHRHHHMFADNLGDPHSPHYFDGKGLIAFIKNVWHAFWGWKYNTENNNLVRPEKITKDLLAEPEIVLINQYFYWLVLASFILPAFLGLALTRTWQGAWTGFIWGGLFRRFVMIILADFVVRVLCHIIGTRPFLDQSKSFSTNLLILTIPTLGSSLHNTHHAFPDSATTSIDWWQLDLTGLLITSLEKTGLAWNVKRPTAKQIEVRRVAHVVR
ncbi:acyl-CoA desaturase [Nostoc sp.]|uniref:acyl-CoA desaturase n=1 Tax=Nostoc sp. TaxID=1180 RepID=UPI002FF560AD